MSAYSDLILATSGLVGYWRLGEAAGTVVSGGVIDSSPNGLHASPTSVTFGVAGAIAGDANTAARFGMGSRIAVGFIPAMQVTTGYSTECWMKPTAMRDYNAGVTRVNVYLPCPFDFYIQANGTGVAYHAGYGGLYGAISAAGVYTAGEWQHIVVTWDGATLKQYRNAVLVASIPVTTVDDPFGKNAVFGARDNTDTQLIGDMDDVALYSRGLSAAEVLAHYTAGTTSLSSLLLQRRRAS